MRIAVEQLAGATTRVIVLKSTATFVLSPEILVRGFIASGKEKPEASRLVNDLLDGIEDVLADMQVESAVI